MADFSVHSTLLVEDKNASVPKSYFVDQANAALSRGLNGIPVDLTALAGRPVVVAPTGLSLAVNEPVDAGGKTVSGYRTKHPTAGDFTAASLTIDSSNAAAYTGCSLRANRGTPQTLTINISAGDGFCLTARQVGAGTLTIAVAGGLTLRNVSSHTGTAGQHAVIGIEIDDTDLVLFGSTA